jgi:GcrA cell cycle regulator
MKHHHAPGEIIWDEYRVARLRALHANKKLSFDAIAAQLSAEWGMSVSKNSCIGKARRMKLAQRPPRTFRRSNAKRKPYAPAPAAVVPEMVPCVLPRWKVMEHEQRPAPGGRITLFQLTENKCRWPHGDRTPYLFCGAPTAGKTYCAYHTGISCGRMAGMARDRVST